MRFIKVYSYDDNGFYLGETMAQRDKKGAIMMPLNSTTVEPLATKDGFVLCWDFVKECWQNIELQKEEPEVVENVKELSYAEKRALEYPYLGDQLDAIFKGFKALQAGESIPQDTIAWLDAIQAVKDKYPKG